ncbi:MAG: transposase [Candidatus Gottesmanbacteria bacterium]|nr:transposase [Candidatus Gottesmanbacteria bacterium]
MGLRKVPLITGEMYHIYNRSVMGTPIFEGKKEAEFFLAAAEYYMHEDPPVKFSLYRTRPQAFSPLPTKKLITVLAYCVMPNHFHFLVRQENDGGIQMHIRKATSSFAHYYGLKNHIHGHIFGGNFKAVHIENNEQLLHVSRYIYLNPVTAYMVEHPEDYTYSSYAAYISKAALSRFVNTDFILGQFRSRGEYKRFVEDQKEYQRDLSRIKYLLLEE